MSDKKTKSVTPRGIARFAHLSSPDFKFKKDGEYKVTLELDAKADAAFVAAIEKAHKKAAADFDAADKKNKLVKLADSPVKPVTDKDGNIVEGKVWVRFKTLASGENKEGVRWNRVVPIFDPLGKPLTGDSRPEIGSGSTIKVSFTSGAFCAKSTGKGITLYLEGVQLLSLVERGAGGSQNAEDFGFGEEEGDFDPENAKKSNSSDDTDGEGEPMTDEDHAEQSESSGGDY